MRAVHALALSAVIANPCIAYGMSFMQRVEMHSGYPDIGMHVDH